MRETIINDKLLPLPALEVRFSASRNLEFLNEARANTSATDNCYKRDVFSFLFHQKIERTLPFTARKRGLYQIYEVTGIGYNFFFRSGYYVELPQQTFLYVYPRQVDTRRIDVLCRAISGTLLSRRRLLPDPFEFSGIREYQRQDPVNHINWKASARTGALMTNQFDSTTDTSLTLIFDMEDKLILKYEDLVEETLRIVSSLSARLARSRMSFRVVGNAADAHALPAGGPLDNAVSGMPSVSLSDQNPAAKAARHEAAAPFSIIIGEGCPNISLLNQKLACMDSKDIVMEMEALLKDEASSKKSGHTYVVVSKSRDDSIIRGLRSLVLANNEVLWVLPIRPAEASSLTSFREPGITRIPWEI